MLLAATKKRPKTTTGKYVNFASPADSTGNENVPLAISHDELRRSRARMILLQALDLEVSEYIDRLSQERGGGGGRLIVGNCKSKAPLGDGVLLA